MNFKQTSYLFLTILLLLLLGTYFNVTPWWINLPIVVLYLIRLVIGATLIQQNFFLTSINSLNDVEINHPKKQSIILSFDDGIHRVNTVKTLDILKQQNIKAMFFIIGKNISGNEDILEKMYDDGHIIGNHSDQHTFWFDMQTSAKMYAEIEQTNEKISKVLGLSSQPVFFRPPYGVTNPNLAKAIQKSGMISVGWSLRSMDTVATSKVDLLESLKNKTKAGDIVLLHDRCDLTVDTLTDYIVFCKQQGFTFTTL